MSPRETQVLSALLCDTDAAANVADPPLRGLGLVPRSVDPDYAETVRAGYVETPDEWMDRLVRQGLLKRDAQGGTS
ncbi:hypothetical protein HYE82_18795 [Streptomyces sp. BR123]|uniref:hypothetical protein n=1 Tax=Streptomyces sp. BR123 TaxID=2749828 RepID=UPI0015C4AFFD|nr:hypothetical protein [Streptomyces sp. BR123]NXY96401.1 hypothetical protein [Streptomyces sp. BR123]